MIKEMAIITGLSGAGKSNAVKIFEDMGFFALIIAGSFDPEICRALSEIGRKYYQSSIGDRRARRAFLGRFEQFFG